MSTAVHPAISEDFVNTEVLYYHPEELRRSARWDIVKMVAILFAASGGIIALPDLIYALLCGGILWQMQYHFPCIRVDHSGISRRVLWWWDLWPWEEFTNGRIGFGKQAYSYEFLDRRWRGTLSLDHLDEGDIQIVNRRIRSVLSLPSVDVPQEVTFCMCWLGTTTVRMTSEGILFDKGRHLQMYHWNEIQATIWRFEPDRPDFQLLWLALPNRYLVLEQQVRTKNWTGSLPEEIVSIICRHVDSTALQDFSLHGMARSVEELDARRSRDEWKQTNEPNVRFNCLVMLAMLILFLVMSLLQQNLFFAWSCALSVFTMHGMYRREVKKGEQRRHDYENQREQILRESATAF